VNAIAPENKTSRDVPSLTYQRFTAEHKNNDTYNGDSGINADLSTMRSYDIGRDASGRLPLLPRVFNATL
jgi:hypothetical protein